MPLPKAGGGKADVQLSAPSGIDCNEMEEAWPKERHPRTAETEGVPSRAVGRLRDHDPPLPIDQRGPGIMGLLGK